MVARSVAQIRDNAAVLDGEIVAVDEHSRPSFQALHHQAAHTVVFHAFDVLHLNGRDLTRLRLEERRRALAKVVNGTRILLSEPLPGTPAQIEAAVRELQLEGVIAKRRDSRGVICGNGREMDSSDIHGLTPVSVAVLAVLRTP